MMRPSDYDIRKAAQINVIRGEVEAYLASAVVDGQPLHALAEIRYYYLGPTGRESEERITEDCFNGRDEDAPRQPGYYAVDVVYHDGRSVLSKPWFAIHRDRDQPGAERRERSSEDGFRELMEEYRILIERLKRESQDQLRKNNALQTELDSFAAAYNSMRKTISALEIERDKAFYDAGQMEHRMQMVLRRCSELEAEAASFKPQIKQMVSGFLEHFGPEAERMFVSLAGGEGGEGEGGRPKKKSPRPPWAGVVGAVASEKKASGGGAGSGKGSEEKKEGKKEDAAAFKADGMPTPETLTAALHWLFWELEDFGKFVCFVQKAEDGVSPLCPWWVIRGVVFYHSGMDLGPDPLWPSDVKDDKGPGPARVEVTVEAAEAEIVPDGDTAGDDAIDASPGDPDDSPSSERRPPVGDEPGDGESSGGGGDAVS